MAKELERKNELMYRRGGIEELQYLGEKCRDEPNIHLPALLHHHQGNVIDQRCSRSRDYEDEDMCSQSTKIINFIDLAGDQKYLKTTVFGLSGYCPHYAVLVVRCVEFRSF